MKIVLLVFNECKNREITNFVKKITRKVEPMNLSKVEHVSPMDSEVFKLNPNVLKPRAFSKNLRLM